MGQRIGTILPMLSHRVLVASCFVVVALAANPTWAQAPKPKDGPLGMKFVPLPKATFYMGWNGEKGSAKKTEIKEDFDIAIHTVPQGQCRCCSRCKTTAIRAFALTCSGR